MKYSIIQILFEILSTVLTYSMTVCTSQSADYSLAWIEMHQMARTNKHWLPLPSENVYFSMVLDCSTYLICKYIIRNVQLACIGEMLYQFICCRPVDIQYDAHLLLFRTSGSTRVWNDTTPGYGLYLTGFMQSPLSACVRLWQLIRF